MASGGEEGEGKAKKSVEEARGEASKDELTEAEPSCSMPSLKRKREQSEPVDVPHADDGSALPRWVAGASPARFITLDELMDMSAAMENMALVHEIAINPQFSIPEQSVSPVEKAVKDCVHRIYWENMKDALAKNPPDYTSAFSTLLDIKTMLLDLLTPQHVRLKAEIESQLDEALLRQQVEKRCLDWPRLSTYIINLLARLCAPVRDEMVAQLRQKTDLIEILRGICELLDVMKVDMANFEVKQSRPIIEEHSATYERNQFMKLLKADPDLELSVFEWLRRHIDGTEASPGTSGISEPAVKRRFEDLNSSEVGAIISDAYMDLLEWNEAHDYPSTLMIDKVRFEQLAEKYLQLVVSTSCVLMSCVLAGQDATDASGFKERLKNDIIIITNDIDQKNLRDRLEAVYIQCDAKLRKLYEDRSSLWTKEKSDDLKLQIMSVANTDNPVRCLMRERIRSFILSMLRCETQKLQQKLPAGVSMVRSELSALTAAVVRLASHNRKTFGTYYGDLIKKLMSKSSL